MADPYDWSDHTTLHRRCSACNGRGYRRGQADKDCENCFGTGKVIEGIPGAAPETDELIYYADATTYVTDPTMELRWNDGVLEQSFVTRGYENGKAKTIRYEWQPVPKTEPS